VITLDDAAPNPCNLDWFGRYIRLAANPFMSRRLAEMNAGIDIWALLGRIQTPCLVVRTEDVWLSADNSRYLAEHIPGAQRPELPGSTTTLGRRHRAGPSGGRGVPRHDPADRRSGRLRRGE
jgi:pimeloyl-ACP methyl ester carboxylesterase